jgi:hypothetical protein
VHLTLPRNTHRVLLPAAAVVVVFVKVFVHPLHTIENVLSSATHLSMIGFILWRHK